MVAEIGEPLISFVIPNRNGARYIQQCLLSVEKSVSGLALGDYEIVISENYSSDRSIQEIKKCQHLPIRLISPDHELDIGMNWTFVTNAARGKYTKFLGSDDLTSGLSILKEIEILEHYKDAIALVSRRRVVDSLGRTIVKSRGYSREIELIEGRKALRKSWLSGTNLIGDPTGLLFRTNELKLSLPWDSSQYPLMVDMTLYVKLFEDRVFVSSGLTVSNFRIHEASVTGSKLTGQAREFVGVFKSTKMYSKKRLFGKFLWLFVVYFMAALKQFMKVFLIKTHSKFPTIRI